MKKIYFIVPCLNNGGAEKVIYFLANELNSKYNVQFIFMNSNLSYYDLSQFIVKYVFNFSLTKKIIYLRKLMKKEKNSIFISFFDKISMILLFSKIGLKNKIIVSERNDPSKSVGKKYIFLRNVLFNFASVIVFQTQDAQNYFRKRIRKKGTIIYNPIDFPKNISISNKKNNTFIAFSRISKQKNIHMMIKAFSEFVKKYPNYFLEIYGDKGNDYENVLDTIDKYNLGNKILLKPYDKNIRDKLGGYVGFLSSSNFEGISNSMLESLAVGLPAICTNCPIGGVKLFIKDGINGYKVNVNDHHSMFVAMEKLIHNPEIYNSCYMEIDNLKKNLSKDVIIRKWINVIEGENYVL